MAYTHQALVLRLIGFFGTTTNQIEQWSTGLRIMNLGPGETLPPPPYTAFLTSIQALVSAFHSSGSVTAGTACYLQKLTAARVGLDGHYLPETQITSEYLYPTAVAGTGSTTFPYSTALVTSLRTPKPRGTASNGRMYYPSTAMTVDPLTGQLAASKLNLYITATKTLFDGINVAAQTLQNGARIVVASQGGKSGVPVSQPVTTIRMEGRLDQQERRENKLIPAWVNATLTIPPV